MDWPCYLFYFVLIPWAFAAGILLGNRTAGLVAGCWTFGQLAWLGADRGLWGTDLYLALLAVSYAVALPLAVIAAGKDAAQRTAAALYLPLLMTALFGWVGKIGDGEFYWTVFAIALAQMAALMLGTNWGEAGRLWRAWWRPGGAGRDSTDHLEFARRRAA